MMLDEMRWDIECALASMHTQGVLDGIDEPPLLLLTSKHLQGMLKLYGLSADLSASPAGVLTSCNFAGVQRLLCFVDHVANDCRLYGGG